MKKMLTFLLVVVALVAVASNASAITCTIDQRPSATLLVPYFQVSVNSDGTIPADSTYRDTILTIGNASTAPVLAHVVVWNHRSMPAIDFEVALTPNDIQSMLMSAILTGHLPATPNANVPSAFIPGGDGDACQRNAAADVYPFSDGYLRFRPSVTPSPLDNSSASTQYPDPAFSNNGSFALRIYDLLDADANDDCDSDTPDGANTGLLTGYITVDMINYCGLQNASDIGFLQLDQLGFENDLFGDYILKSGSGLPTYGNPTVDIEAATGLPCNGGFEGTAGVPGSLNGCVWTALGTTPVVRTFYARYWEDPDIGNSGVGVATIGDQGGTSGQGAVPTSENCYLFGGVTCDNPVGVFPWLVDSTYGDMREPLGGNYAARYVTSEGISSFLRVWRAGGGDLKDLSGASCTAEEASPGISLFDEDENTTTSGVCPSPCSNPPVNIPFETQRDNVTALFGSGLPGGSGGDGWINLNLINSGDALSTNLDQGWVGYDFETSAAFLNAGIEGTQLDQSDCFPVNPASLTTTLPNPLVVLPIAPAIPSH